MCGNRDNTLLEVNNGRSIQRAVDATLEPIQGRIAAQPPCWRNRVFV